MPGNFREGAVLPRQEQGKHKSSPLISPKTVEQGAGGQGAFPGGRQAGWGLLPRLSGNAVHALSLSLSCGTNKTNPLPLSLSL